MICKSCGQETEDGKKFCLHCGKRADGKKQCPSCGALMPDYAQYCGDCGAALNAAAPGQKDDYNEIAAVDAAGLYENGYISPVGGEGVQTETKRKKILENVCCGLVGVAALFGFIFAFLIGVKAEVSGIGTGVDLYHYFGGAYEEISQEIGAGSLSDAGLTALYFPAVAGTLIAAAAIVLAVVFGSVTLAAVVKKFVYKKDVNFVKPAILTYLSFALCATAFLAQHAMSTTSSLGTTVSAEFNDATLAALIIGGIMLGAYCACRVAVRLYEIYKSEGNLSGVIAALVAGIITVVVIAVLALPVINFSEGKTKISAGYNGLLSMLNLGGKVGDEEVKSIVCGVIGFAVQIVMLVLAVRTLFSFIGYATTGETENPLGFVIATAVLSGVNTAMAVVGGNSYIGIETGSEISGSYGAPIALTVLSVLLLVAVITFKIYSGKAPAYDGAKAA